MFYESYDRHLNYKQSKAFLELCFQEASKAAFLSVYLGIYMDCEEDYHRMDKKIPRPSSLSDIIFLDEEKRIWEADSYDDVNVLTW